MKIGIIGITGRLGVRLAKQALERGNQVIGMNRRPERVSIRLEELEERVETMAGDTNNLEDIELLMKKVDVVIHCTAPTREQPEDYVKGVVNTLRAAENTQIERMLFIGHSFTLTMENGKMFMDNKRMRPNFMKIFGVYPSALDEIKANETVNWTIAIPPINLFPYGEITKGYTITDCRLPKSVTVENSDDTSRLSMEDFANAIIDEIDKNDFSKKCFSISYA